MEKKFYNFETLFRSLRDGLRAFLKDSGIYYELSELGYEMGFRGWHFEILANASELAAINAWLDEHTITEQR